MLVESSYVPKIFFASSFQCVKEDRVRTAVNCVALAILLALVIYQVWDWCYPGRKVEKNNLGNGIDGESHGDGASDIECFGDSDGEPSRSSSPVEESKGGGDLQSTDLNSDDWQDWMAGHEARKELVLGERKIATLISFRE